MDQIDNMQFKSSRHMGLWYAPEEMKEIKATVSRRLNIGHEELHEIALEDVEVDRRSQLHIYSAFYDLAVVAEISGDGLSPETESPGVPCTGFWIESSQDLILYAWNDYQARTIVVPRAEWFLREGIIIH